VKLDWAWQEVAGTVHEFGVIVVAAVGVEKVDGGDKWSMACVQLELFGALATQ